MVMIHNVTEDRRVGIDRNRIGAIFLIIIAILSLYGLHLIFSPFYKSILWAVIIGVAFWPVYRRVRRLMGGRASWSSLMVVIGIVLFFLIPSILVIQSLIEQIGYAYNALQPWLPEILEKVSSFIPVRDTTFKGTVMDNLQELGKVLIAYLSSATGNILSITFQLAVTVVLLFFLFRDGEGLLEKIKRSSLIPSRDVDVFIREIGEVIRAVIYGVILTAMIQGTLGGIGFWVLGLPAPVLFGTIMFILAVIPFAGTAVVWLPASLWLMFTGKIGKGIFLLLWGVLVISMIDNFLRPYFIGRYLGFHVVLTFIGILGGVMAFGFLGVFLGPLLLAISIKLFDMYLKVPP